MYFCLGNCIVGALSQGSLGIKQCSLTAKNRVSMDSIQISGKQQSPKEEQNVESAFQILLTLTSVNYRYYTTEL